MKRKILMILVLILNLSMKRTNLLILILCPQALGVLTQKKRRFIFHKEDKLRNVFIIYLNLLLKLTSNREDKGVLNMLAN